MPKKTTVPKIESLFFAGNGLIVTFQVPVDGAPSLDLIPWERDDDSSGEQLRSGTLNHELACVQLDGPSCLNIAGYTLVNAYQSEYSALRGVRRRVSFCFGAACSRMSAVRKYYLGVEFDDFSKKVWDHGVTYTNRPGQPVTITLRGESTLTAPRQIISVL